MTSFCNKRSFQGRNLSKNFLLPARKQSYLFGDSPFQMPALNGNGISSSHNAEKSSLKRGFSEMSCWQIATSALLIGFGALLLFGGLVNHTILVPYFVKLGIMQNSQLVPDSILWSKWTKPEYKIRFNLNVFSVKNPDQFMRGEKPHVIETGPYVFNKKMENRVISAGNGTVKYHRINTFHFNEKESCQTCILGNRIWVPNMIYQKFVEAASTEGMKAAATTLLSQTAFLEVEVDELLFEGYKDPFLDKVCEIPFMNFVCEAILDIPDRIGLFYEANNTNSKIFEIDDGTKNANDLGKILKYDDEEELDESWWSTSESRQIHGTDGSLFKPFISKSDKLYVFVVELCRTIWLEFEKEVEFRDLKAYRFILPKEVFDLQYPGNQGFCNPTEKEIFPIENVKNNTENCLPHGLLDISKCQRGQPPIAISLPNFLYAPKFVADSIVGLKESNVESDSIIVDIEPRIGAVLFARRVSQVNVEMWKGKNLSFPVNLKKMNSALIPVLKVAETSEIDDESLQTIKSDLYDMEWYAYLAMKILMILGAITLALGLISLAFFLGLFDGLLGRRRPKTTDSRPPYIPKGEPFN
ncbi:unnamed protein product [Caenorhabditis angaria]|uniref:Uncharacterized protein n=1 Tax=Caenorhabditis angaria TaxID=860376 RepID=A0A9P1IH52_9PELO|nr:unnamed protein product [Caenorhabditis angaria]